MHRPCGSRRELRASANRWAPSCSCASSSWWWWPAVLPDPHGPEGQRADAAACDRDRSRRLARSLVAHPGGGRWWRGRHRRWRRTPTTARARASNASLGATLTCVDHPRTGRDRVSSARSIASLGAIRRVTANRSDPRRPRPGGLADPRVARAASDTPPIRHRDGGADVARRAAAVPRWPARRPLSRFHRRVAGTARRRDRLLGRRERLDHPVAHRSCNSRPRVPNGCRASTEVNGLGITLAGTTVPGRRHPRRHRRDRLRARPTVCRRRRPPAKRGPTAASPPSACASARRSASVRETGAVPRPGLGARHELSPAGRALRVESADVATRAGDEPTRRGVPPGTFAGARRRGRPPARELARTSTRPRTARPRRSRRADACLSSPGTREQKSTFAGIIDVTFLVVGLVVALFFVLLTIERTALRRAQGSRRDRPASRGRPDRTRRSSVGDRSRSRSASSSRSASPHSCPPDSPAAPALPRCSTSLVGVTAAAVLGGAVSRCAASPRRSDRPPSASAN